MLDPRALSCQHLFCLKCLFHLVNDDRGSTLIVKCPFNCEPTTTKSGVKGLPKNSLVSSWCEKVRRSRTLSDAHVCEYCDEPLEIGSPETSAPSKEEVKRPSWSDYQARRKDLVGGTMASTSTHRQAMNAIGNGRKRCRCEGCSAVLCDGCLSSPSSTHSFLCAQQSAGDAPSQLTYPFYLTAASVAMTMKAMSSTGAWRGSRISVVECQPVYVPCEEVEICIEGRHGSVVGEASYSLSVAPGEYECVESLLDQHPMADNSSSHLLAAACSGMQRVEVAIDEVGDALGGIEKVMKFSRSPTDGTNSQFLLDTILFLASFALEAVVPALVRLAMAGMMLAVESDMGQVNAVTSQAEHGKERLLAHLKQRIGLSALCLAHTYEAGQSVLSKCVSVMGRVRSLHESFQRQPEGASKNLATPLLKFSVVASQLENIYIGLWGSHQGSHRLLQSYLTSCLRGVNLIQAEIDALTALEYILCDSTDALVAASTGVSDLHVLWSALCATFGDDFEGEYLDDVWDLLLLPSTAYHRNYMCARSTSSPHQMSTTEDVLEMLSPLVDVLDMQQATLSKKNALLQFEPFVRLHKRTAGLALKTFNMFGKNQAIMISNLNLVKKNQLSALGNGLVQLLNHMSTAAVSLGRTPNPVEQLGDSLDHTQRKHFEGIIDVLDDVFSQETFHEPLGAMVFPEDYVEGDKSSEPPPRMNPISLNCVGILEVTWDLIDRLKPLGQQHCNQTAFLPIRYAFQRKIESVVAHPMASSPISVWPVPGASTAHIANSLDGHNTERASSGVVDCATVLSFKEDGAAIQIAQVDRKRARDRAIRMFQSSAPSATEVRVKTYTTVGTRLVPIYIGTMVVESERNAGNLLLSIWPNAALSVVRQLVWGPAAWTPAPSTQEIAFLFSGQMPTKFHGDRSIPLFAKVINVTVGVATSNAVLFLVNAAAVTYAVWKWRRGDGAQRNA